MEPPNPALQRTCVACHRPINDEANVCPNCGHDYRPSMTGHAWESAGTPLPLIGGALIAYAGLAHAMGGFILWVITEELNEFFPYLSSSFLMALLGFVSIAAGAVSIAGGAYAIARRRLGLTLIGGAVAVSGGIFVSIYTLGALVTTSLALLGVLLVAVARDEFVD